MYNNYQVFTKHLLNKTTWKKESVCMGFYLGLPAVPYIMDSYKTSNRCLNAHHCQLQNIKGAGLPCFIMHQKPRTIMSIYDVTDYVIR